MNTEQTLNQLPKTDLIAVEQLPESVSTETRENIGYRNTIIESIISYRNEINQNAVKLQPDAYQRVNQSYQNELQQKTDEELETLLAINIKEDTFTGKYK